jgi:ABC-2 type transport system ATP-binding protein
MGAEPILEAEAVERRYGSRQALVGLDLRLARGEVLGLLGPNGAGKTTCLRVLSGNLAPTAGRVAITGIDLAREPLRAKRQLGYLPERAPIYPELTVNEYLTFCARLRRLPRRAVAEAVDRAKARTGLVQAGSRLLGRLSKGWRQRVGLAQALIHDPELIILDEPTDGLDPMQTREVRSLIAELADHAAVIVASHVLPEVQAVCSRVMILRDGRVQHHADLRADAEAPPWLRVRLERPTTADQLAMLEPVAAVEPAGHRCFRIALADDATAAQLARVLVAQQLGLSELTAERSDLERIFFQNVGAEGVA